MTGNSAEPATILSSGSSATQAGDQSACSTSSAAKSTALQQPHQSPDSSLVDFHEQESNLAAANGHAASHEMASISHQDTALGRLPSQQQRQVLLAQTAAEAEQEERPESQHAQQRNSRSGLQDVSTGEHVQHGQPAQLLQQAQQARQQHDAQQAQQPHSQQAQHTHAAQQQCDGQLQQQSHGAALQQQEHGLHISQGQSRAKQYALAKLKSLACSRQLTSLSTTGLHIAR